MSLTPHRKLSLALIALLAMSSLALAQGGEDPNLPPSGEMRVFPYTLNDYTQAGHEYRIHNAQAVVFGEIVHLRELTDTEKTLNWVATLHIEEFLRMDRPAQQDGMKEIQFRFLPLSHPHEEMKVGDRCLVLLSRDRRQDSMLLMSTDYHYYPVSADGVVTKLFKEAPTVDPPLLREVGLKDFLAEMRRIIERISIQEQALEADLVLHGRVTEGAQGNGPESDYYIATITPEKIYKGDPGDGDVMIHSVNDMIGQVLRTLNRPVFRKGQDVFIFANKDPTLSEAGPHNPDGEDRWMLLYDKQSMWDVHPKTVWRFGTQPIKTDEFFQTIEELTAP